ncbi:2-succinyl-6-hydroxy-2,4-cyclohexadiene-1-carboxylate synthase [Priestia taiwanensis]|uniref:Putative 2-succinyl-6-hydroxy-2,4-cyclohexadiene-1-carboxylate synthase n=1 Tax=Priestia taiwanensis TaxID=1347902 RepID=A0A917ERN1_9BACI|nr:2-succinyl-6-hydroxy-2,4-cyclohexadiene-1-carboxylate synthase [Priestia taiwanensis]MBM7363325.1 2-succinyl-6-hydroxy-2,4-cyclohexadiene-1-carboxylate synthase [Priestia taiwanensis]GGE78094.1 putative 2-succinyl-6-hydroxy-2,4-cyclohexadiene-1-carboxylate synthase [Priestia taiwanensis]
MNVQLNGVDYSYDIVGSGEALLVLHGFTGSKQTWHPFINNWSKQYKVITVDLLGHGETESPSDVTRYDIEYVAKDMIALLDALQITKAHVLGYSMGGRVALTMACLYGSRVQSLIVESTTAGLRTEEERVIRREQDATLAMNIDLFGVEAFIDEWEQIPLFESHKHLPDEKKEALREERLNQCATGLANSLLGMGTGSQPSWWEILHTVELPVTILCGEWDSKFCYLAKELEECLPYAKKIKVLQAGHAIHVEQPEKFDTIVMDCLQQK